MIAKNITIQYTEDVILSWYGLATARIRAEGLEWYTFVHNFAGSLASEYGITLEHAAAVIAVLSPGCLWEQNLVDAENVVRSWRQGLAPEDVTVQTYNPQKQKAFLILESPLFDVDRLIGSQNARKTRAFFRNIVDPAGPDVTIDRWIARAVLLTQKAAHPTENVYRLVEKAFQNVSRRLELSPSQLQAVVWLVIRDRGLVELRDQAYLF